MKAVEECAGAIERAAIAYNNEREIGIWVDAAKRAGISFLCSPLVPFARNLVCGLGIGSESNDGVGIEIVHPRYDRIECGVASTSVQIDASNTGANEVGENHFQVRTIGNEEHAGR